MEKFTSKKKDIVFYGVFFCVIFVIDRELKGMKKISIKEWAEEDRPREKMLLKLDAMVVYLSQERFCLYA